LGLNSVLCGAEISRTSDHLLVRTMLGSKVWLSDVGNGQPYLEPFPVNGYHIQTHLGWEMRTTGDGKSLDLERRSPDQPDWKRVYVANPSPRTWRAFAGAIDKHHRDPEFGPFLRGLRAVQVGANEMITVRDDVVTIYSDRGYERSTYSVDSIYGLLAGRMGLGRLPIAAALAAWQRAIGTQ
jgi:arylamine N-acetyltransferase